VISFPGSKINIGLHVLNRRFDGYHNIETVFYPLALADGLEIIPAEGNTEFSLSGLVLPESGKSNLCIRAYELLKREYDLPPVRIHLHKKIPSGSGLGGGSSNAANTLVLLDQIFHLELGDEKLAGYARKLGADCAFFIYNKPLFAYNKGDRFEDADITLQGYHIIVVKPKTSVDTSEAYKKIKPAENRKTLKELVCQPVDQWKNTIENDFEKIVFKEHSVIEKIKSSLYKKGAIYASMTGSGSAVYGIFDRDPENLDEHFGKCFIWKEKVKKQKF